MLIILVDGKITLYDIDIRGQRCKPSDDAPPEITRVYPNGTLQENDIVMGADTNENATCKYDIIDTDYNLMNYNL